MLQCFLILRESAPRRNIREKAKGTGYPVEDLRPPFEFSPSRGKNRCDWVFKTFEALASEIESRIEGGITVRGVPRCAAVVDLGVERVQGLSCLNPLADTPDLNWTTVVGMLILAFPEVQWIIANQPGLNAPPLLCGRGGLAPNRLDYDCDLEALLQLLDEGYSPLFDGTGSVSEIRKAMAYAVPSEKGIVVRASKAAAIDDETPYAFLCAYTAYRFGCCSFAISTYAMMRRIFGSGGQPVVNLTFEDMFVNFPDTPGDELADELGVDRKDLHLSKLEMRDRAFPGVADVPLRALVTVGHEHVLQKIVASNQEYRAKREKGCGGRPKIRFKDVFKPVGGVFDLHRALGADAPCRIDPSGNKAVRTTKLATALQAAF